MLELGKGLLGEGLEYAACGGESDLASAALEETMADVSLERTDLRGDGGLGDVEFFSSLRKAFLTSYFEERAEPVKIHCTIQTEHSRRGGCVVSGPKRLS